MTSILRIFGLSFFILTSGWGQCPSRSFFLQQVEATQSQEDIQKLLQIQKQWKACGYSEDSTYARVLHLLGRYYWHLGQQSSEAKDAIAKAEYYTKTSIKINERHHSQTKEANLVGSYLNLGLLYMKHLGRYKEAISSFKSSVEIGKKYPTKYAQAAEASVQLSACYRQSGDYLQAGQWASEALALAKKANNTYWQIWALNEKYQSLYALGKYEEGQQALQSQIRVIEVSGHNENLGSVYSKMASLYRVRGKYEQMNHYFEKAYQLYVAQQDSNKIAVVSNDWGYSLADYMKQYDEAEKRILLGLKFAKNKELTARLYDNLGYTYLLQKKYGKCLEAYQQALQMLGVEKLSSSEPLLLKDIPQKTYLLDIVRIQAEAWLEYAKTTNNNPSKLAQAIKTYALADNVIDYMRWEHSGAQSKLFWRRKTRAIYERAIEACFLAKDTEQAFRFFEKSKAVLLADKLNELGANQQLSVEQREKEARLRQQIADFQTKVASLEKETEAYTKAQTQLDQYQAEWEKFIKSLEKTNPTYYRYKYDNSTLSLKDLKEDILKGGQSFVSYFVGDSAVYALTVFEEKTNLLKLSIKPQEYYLKAHAFLSLCADKTALNVQYKHFRALSFELYNALWKPLSIATRRVIVSSDGEFLPFETLSESSSSDDFLVNYHALSYTYSARFLAKTGEIKIENTSSILDKFHSYWQGVLTTQSFLGVAPVSFSNKQATLKGSEESLQAIGADFWRSRLFSVKDATKANFLTYAPKSRIIQLFTHADADSAEATEPKIYFVDSTLVLSELSRLERFNTDLLVLSACKTGVGHNQRGEGVYSLARGFAALGILSTVTTLWQVEDNPTYALTESFYKFLQEGLPKDEALQKAKLEWLAQGSAADKLPSQWAGVLLVGSAAALPSQQLWYWLGGLLVAIVIGILWRRRNAF